MNTFASVRDRLVADFERGGITFSTDRQPMMHVHSAVESVTNLICESDAVQNIGLIYALVETSGLSERDIDATEKADRFIEKMDPLAEGNDDERRALDLAVRWFVRFSEQNDVILAEGSPPLRFSSGLRLVDEDARGHVLRNISSPWEQDKVLRLTDSDLAAIGMPDLREIVLDDVTDEERADRILAYSEDAGMWLDWCVNKGPHPEEGRWYFRYDGDRYYQVIERETHRVAYASRWARSAEAIALVLIAHPDMADAFEAQMGARYDDEDAKTAWTALGESIADWRSANLTYFDPWAPKEPMRTPVAEAARRTSADENAMRHDELGILF